MKDCKELRLHVLLITGGRFFVAKCLEFGESFADASEHAAWDKCKEFIRQSVLHADSSWDLPFRATDEEQIRLWCMGNDGGQEATVAGDVAITLKRIVCHTAADGRLIQDARRPATRG